MINDVVNKHFLGSLVQYYRNKNNLTREEMIELITSSNHKCSYNTLRRIERGENSSDSYYKVIVETLGFDFCDNYEDYIVVDEILNRLISTINDSKISVLISQYNKILELRNKFVNTFYISELLRLCLAVINLYINGEDNNEGLIDIFDETDILADDKIALLSNYVLFKHSRIGSHTKYDSLHYGKYLSGKQIFYLDQISYDLAIMNSYDILRKNEIDYKQIKNPILKVSVIETLACCKLNLGATLECRDHLIECINIPNIKEYLPYVNYLHTIKRLGIVEFELGNYKNSYRYLSSVASENYLVLGMNFLLLFRAAELIDYKENILLIVNEYKNVNKVLNILKEKGYYATSENELDMDELEDLICEYLPSSCFQSSIYLDIFSNEINSLVSKTKHYSSLYKFLNN